jgi:exonuclease III
MLELATWNVAGLQAPDKLGSLVSNCRTLSPMVFLLQETHLTPVFSTPDFFHVARLGFPLPSS